MSSILEFVKTNQSLTFQELGLTELDVAVLNELAYLPLTNVQEAIISDEFRRLEEVVNYSEKSFEELSFSFMLTKNRLALLKSVLASKRYANLMVGFYVNNVNPVFEEQFAAVVAHIPELDYYQLIFRGTDETLIGWKEDANMTYMSEIPAQRSACRYLKRFLMKNRHQITISGHSKGGNLAVYSASFIPDDLQSYIDTIYIFDAPGLHRHVLEKRGYQNIRQRIKAYKPKESIVGILLSSDIPSAILESKARGVFQHDLFTWEIDQQEFMRVEQLSHLSVCLQKTLTDWMTEYSKHDLKDMSDTVFDLFFSLGIDNLDELRDIDLHTTKALLERISHLDDNKRRLLFDALKHLLGLYHHNSLDLTFQKRKASLLDKITSIQKGVEKLIDKPEEDKVDS